MNASDGSTQLSTASTQRMEHPQIALELVCTYSIDMEVEAATNSWKVVNDPKVAAFLTQRHELRLLEPFMGGETTIRAAAEQLGLSENTMFRRVKQLQHWGILEIARTEARRGRPIHYYRCTASEYRVPIGLLPLIESVFRGMDDHTHDLYERNLAALLLEEAAREPDWAVRITRNQVGRVVLNLSPKPGMPWQLLGIDAPAMIGDWTRLQLDFEEAKALQRELIELWWRYAKQRGCQTYLFGMFLVPHSVSDT
jgi:predicted transcriptional regulator